MKKMFVNAALAAYVVAGLTACVNESLDNLQPVSASDETVVELKFAEAGFTRAVGSSVQDETAVTFTSGYAVFANSTTGAIEKVTQLVATTVTPTTDEIAAGSKIQVNSSSMTIYKVPGTVDRVYVIGNLPSTFTAPTLYADTTAVSAAAIAIASQGDADAGTVKNVTLFGRAAVTVTASTKTATATVPLNALDARIEIAKISYKSTETYLTGWKLDGIFVDNYLATMQLNGVTTVNPTTQTVADNTAADAAYADNKSLYLTAVKGLLYDWNATPTAATGTPLAVSAGASSVWAYNVLTPRGTAAPYFVSPATKVENPRIIIRLSALTNEDGPAFGGLTRYLTVTKFIGSDGNEVTFTQGNIYKVTDLVFADSNLDPIPNLSSVTATVTVTPMKWNVVEVTAGFDH